MKKRRNTSHKEALQEIALPNNIVSAYWKLKRYHRDEDVGFYDDFDFSYFEGNLYTYSRYIARALEKEEEIPLVGYLNLKLPKKLDENNQMRYRPMVYSSVFDLVVVQSIFNVVGRIIEDEFHECSYGYRMDVNNPGSENIFIDWREHYPRFRSKALAWLRQRNIKYYICCDIQGFYDHVSHKLLVRAVERYCSEWLRFTNDRKNHWIILLRGWPARITTGPCVCEGSLGKPLSQ